MRLFARYLTAALLAVALLALSFGTGARPAAAAPAATLTNISLSASTVTVVTGASGSTVVTVTKNTQNNNSSASLSVSWQGGSAPTDVTTSFSPTSVIWNNATGNSGPKTSTLTINTTANTPAGSYGFTVRARRNAGDFQTINGTLVVSAAQAPTITFGPAPTPTYLGGNFTVAATSNSAGAKTYSRVSGPCALVSAAAGTFSSSGAGTCVVQVSVAAAGAYSAGSAQQSVTIAQASQTISFAALQNKTLGAAPFALAATASSGLALSFSSSTPAVCSVSGNTVTLVAIGTCTIAADQAGNANFLAAAPVAQSFEVLAAAASGCSLSGNTRTCNLWAQSGTISLPGSPSLPVWSYTDSASGLPGAIGPTLEAVAGETLVINLTNNLGEATSIQISGLPSRADPVGAAASGGTASYSFSSLPAGTYLYQAGLLTGSGPRQIAMGLVGALVVREAAANSAYGHSYDQEALLVYSEIDPNFNTNPAGFVLQQFNPVYLLINGKVYPSTDLIASQAGHSVLLRQVNAGMRFHSLGVLGLRQTVLAEDGGALPISSSIFARTLGAGQSMDSLVTIPANAPNGSRYAIFETGMPGHGPAGANGMGGMLTFITAQAASSDIVGPQVTVSLTPSAVTVGETAPVALAATADDGSTGGSFITAASYSIDSGTPVAFSLAGSNVSEGLSAALDVSTLAVGAHTVAVTASDAAGNATTATAALTVNPLTPPADTAGPVVSGVSLASPSNSTTSVALSAVATDNVGVTAASYSISGGGAAFSFTPASSVSLSANVDVSGLADGVYPVTVTASDAAGNPSNVGSVSLTLDRGAPTVSGAASPSQVAPGAGVALSASFSDSLTRIVSASYALDGGAAVSLSAQDGVFDSSGESAQAVVGTAGLALGGHSIVVSASDAAGNVGTQTITFTVNDTLFADGFESNTFSGWSSRSTTTTRLAVNTAAAMDGTTYGLQASFGSSGTTNQNYVQRNLTSSETQLHVRFYLNPHNQNFGTGAKTIFRALNGTTEAFRLEIRQANGGYQVRALVARANGTSNTGWQTINANAANYIEIVWAQGGGAQFQLYVNSAAPVSLNNLVTSAYSVNTLRLGPQTSGTNSTNVYLDEFVVTRSTLIGQ